jgi:hypothetical protein
MLPNVGNLEVPSANDNQRVRTKYATELPPPPPEPFSCPSNSPYPLKESIGTLNWTTYRLGGCLDGTTRPQTTFYFNITASKRVSVGVGADKAELNVELVMLVNNSVIWRGPNDGMLGKKSDFLDLPPGGYSLVVRPSPAGTTYTTTFEVQ